MTIGEAHDATAYPALMDEDAPDTKVLIADRGFDAHTIRSDVEARGGPHLIPTKRNRRAQVSTDSAIYALRRRIERAIDRLKNAHRVATRYDKSRCQLPGFV